MSGFKRREALKAGAVTGLALTGIATSMPVSGQTEAGVAWKLETDGAVRSSPTVSGGNTFVGSDDGNLYAAGADDGSIQWQFETDGEVRASPTVSPRGIVYFGSLDERLYAAETASGSETWRYGEFEVEGEVKYGATLGQDLVWFGSDGGGVFGMQPFQGERDFDFSVGPPIEAPPRIVGEQLVFANERGTVYVMDIGLANVEERLQFVANVPSPMAVQDQTIYLDSEFEGFNAINIDDGEVTWTTELEGWAANAAPGLAENTLFVAGGESGNVYALETETGNQVWQFEAGGPVETTPEVANGTVYVGSDDGNVYAIDQGSGEQVWQFEIGDSIRSSPTVADGLLYVGSDDGSLYALDIEAIEGGLESEEEEQQEGEQQEEEQQDEEQQEEEQQEEQEEEAMDEEEESTQEEESQEEEPDGDGPGFGVGATLAGLGGATYLLRERLGNEE